VKQCKQLTTLILNYANVTDAGLKELKDPKELRMIQLFGCKFTDAGFRDFKQAHPNCKTD
jgi:phosphatidylserine decarboxylase